MVDLTGNRRLMRDLFGDDWEWRLTAAGIVGGETEADEDAELVAAWAAELWPDLDEEDLRAIGDAWFQIWCVAGIESGVPVPD